MEPITADLNELNKIVCIQLEELFKAFKVGFDKFLDELKTNPNKSEVFRKSAEFFDTLPTGIIDLYLLNKSIKISKKGAQK